MSARDATGVTVLRCTGTAKATKQWQWNPTLQQWTRISYQAGAKFTAAEHQVADLAGLAALLEQLRSDPAAFVVRGALAPDAAAAVAADPTHRIRRRKLNKGGVAPTLVEASRAWIGVDFDSWPLRPSDDLATDPDSAIDTAIRELLPEPFHDAEAFWVLSSSAGFVPDYLKAHVWFWLTKPATNEHLKAVLKQCAPGIDHALYNAAQVHFSADPIILNGHDPIPRRTGWRKGLEPAVRLPALLPAVRKPNLPAGGASPGRKGSALDALAYLGDGEGGQGFHAPLRTATMRYARDAARSGDRDDAHIKATLLQAVQDAPARPGRSLADYSDDYLQRLIDGAFALLAGQADIVTMRPHHAPTTQSVDEARDAIGMHVGDFFARTLAWHGLDDASKADRPPEHAGILAGVGTGKSTATRAPLPAFVQAAKAAELPHRALWLVPTHKLGAESLAEMQRLGINAAVLRGRDAFVPGTGDPENFVVPERMCMNLDAVGDALAIGAGVEESVCGSATSGKPSCPWRSGPGQCAFQAQKPAVAEADIVIAAHQSLFHELAKEARADLAAVIVDEGWWQAGLIEARDVHLDSFAQEPLAHPVLERGPQPGSRPRANILDTADLHTSSAKVERAFKTILPGQLLGKAAVENAGLTAGECAAAAVLEWRRKVEGVILPGQAATVRRERMKEAAGNAAGAVDALGTAVLALPASRTLSGKLKVALARSCLANRLDREASSILLSVINDGTSAVSPQQALGVFVKAGRPDLADAMGAQLKAQVQTLLDVAAEKTGLGDFKGAVQTLLDARHISPGNLPLMLAVSTAILRQISELGWDSPLAEQCAGVLATIGKLDPAHPQLSYLHDAHLAAKRKYGIAT